MIARLEKQYASSISIAPDDGCEFCECPKCKVLDAGDMDTTVDCVSITDRYVNFCNAVAGKVSARFPDVILSFLAYVQYTRPPVRETLHPNLVPIIAPITYCRAHTMVDPKCPSRQTMLQIAKGWGRAARRVAYYNYMYHLAEVSAPYPMMTQLSVELPLLYTNGVKCWFPETLPSFDSNLPGMVLSIRMAWDAQQKPPEILDEFFARYYGGAADARGVAPGGLLAHGRLPQAERSRLHVRPRGDRSPQADG